MHFFIVVTFNEIYYETDTYKSLVDLVCNEQEEFGVYIWDNSYKLDENNNKTEKNFKNFHYHFSGSNEKLSVLYNSTINKLFNENLAHSITILDQDSKLERNFFIELKKYKGDKLVVPFVRSNISSKIISPRYQYFYNLKREVVVKQLGVNSGYVSTNDFFSVGSGLTFNKCLWGRGIRFEEQLGFYGVDTEFCFEYAQIEDVVYVLNTSIEHDISDETGSSSDISYWRFLKYTEYWAYRLSKYDSFPKILSKLIFNYWVLKNRIKRKITNVTQG
jgi:GT2 family glycosyltransferase